jgi:hypothetical protein
MSIALPFAGDPPCNWSARGRGGVETNALNMTPRDDLLFGVVAVDPGLAFLRP